MVSVIENRSRGLAHNHTECNRKPALLASAEHEGVVAGGSSGRVPGRRGRSDNADGSTVCLLPGERAVPDSGGGRNRSEDNQGPHQLMMEQAQENVATVRGMDEDKVELGHADAGY